MKRVNQIEPLVIRLRRYMAGPDGWGHTQGREVYTKLLRDVEICPERLIIYISLAEVRRTDASFPRESVIELARRFRGHRGFCLVDMEDEDLLENWDAAALRREQPLACWNNDVYRILGPQPSSGNADIFRLLISDGRLTASIAASKLGLKLTNASTKLKQLSEQGFALRLEEVAQSGGIEFAYLRIG